MIAASLRRFWDDTFRRFLFLLADKSVTKPSFTNYPEDLPKVMLPLLAFAPVQAS